MAAVFSFLGVTGILVVRVQQFWWGYYPRYSLLIAPPFLLFFFGYLIVSLVEFVRAYPKSRGVEKKRIRLLLIAFAVAYLGCVDYLPKFGIAVYPFGYAALLGFVVIVAIAFRKYDLVAITPSLAAREIIGTMADVLFVCDRDGRIEFANAAAERVLGYRAESLVGRQFDELLVTRDDDPFSDSIRRRSIRNMERRFAASDGHQVDLMMSLAPVLQHGEPAGVVILGRDMREQKDAEREVRKAVTLLESTLDSTADGILVIGDGGRVLTYNKRFVDMWRIPAELLEASDDRGLITLRARSAPRSAITSCARSTRSMRNPRRRVSSCSSSKTDAASSATRSAARSKASPTCASGASATSRRVSPPRRRCASRSCAIGCCSSRTPPASA